jgi:hypothetical protein
MGGEIDEGRHIGLVRKAALAGSPISFFGVGGSNFASFSPPYRSGRKREGTSQKTTVRGLASASSTSIMTITILEDFSMRNYDSANIRQIERRIV